MLNRRSANEYNSLADIHLQAYFTNRNLLRHLRKAGLINKKKEIVPESTYRANITRAEQKREVKEALAQAIVYKSLDLQLKRESEIQKRLEEIAKLELVKKIRSERLQRRTQSNPSSRSSSGQHPAWKYFTLYPNRQDSFSASRPQTAYGKQNIRESTSLTSVETASCIDSYSESTTTTSLRESELPMKHARGDGNIRDHLRKPNRILQQKCGPNLTKYDQEKLKTSPYLYPVHNTEKKTLKLCDIPSGSRNICLPPESMANKRTNCRVTMLYWGTGKTISWEESSPGTEIVIQQQHCGGNTLCVYRGHHKANEKFSFVSHRHLNFPFSLSIYLAGILYLRVSACCEYRHHKGSRLGGPQGLLSLLNVQGASPCARCQLNRQMSEKNRKKKMKNDSKASEDEQTNGESTASPLAEIQDIKELSESEDDKKKAENRKDLTKPGQQEARHDPILFNVSGTVINVEESSSEEEDDYQDDFEDEEEAKTVEGLRNGETDHKDEEEVGQMKDTDGGSGETISSGSEENSFSEEDKKEEKETNDRKEAKEEEVVKIKDDGDIGEEVVSAKSEDKNSPGRENDVMGSSSSDKNGEKKDKESKSPEDSAENVEEKKVKGSVEDLKNEKNVPITNSVLTREKAPESQRDESDIDGQSDTNSSRENNSSSSSSSPQPPTSRKKSKLKPEMRFRANNHKNVPDSSSESDSIAHLPEELEGTEKAKNWIPASQQKTI